VVLLEYNSSTTRGEDPGCKFTLWEDTKPISLGRIELEAEVAMTDGFWGPVSFALISRTCSSSSVAISEERVNLFWLPDTSVLRIPRRAHRMIDFNDESFLVSVDDVLGLIEGSVWNSGYELVMMEIEADSEGVASLLTTGASNSAIPVSQSSTREGGKLRYVFLKNKKVPNVYITD
jgi:hypothetical protein